jgi:hypothetical protein
VAQQGLGSRWGLGLAVVAVTRGFGCLPLLPFLLGIALQRGLPALPGRLHRVPVVMSLAANRGTVHHQAHHLSWLADGLFLVAVFA